jgi:hypothetical protein
MSIDAFHYEGKTGQKNGLHDAALRDSIVQMNHALF